jgi:hypothetical protein
LPLATYTIGPPTQPHIVYDNGFLDKFALRKPTTSDYADKVKAIMLLEGAEAVQHIPFAPHNHLADALGAYRHFLFGNGAPRTFSYERYVESDESGKITLANAIKDAQAGALQLFRDGSVAAMSPPAPGPLGYRSSPYPETPVYYQMTGSALAANARSAHFPYPDTENWQKAIGAHDFWISANVLVEDLAPMFSFSMDFTLHAEDRYNFNPGASDIATGIPDAMNGVLEVSGLAKQYMNYSELKRFVTWTGMGVGNYDSTSSDGSRVRPPSDNRRLRNRT